MPVESLSIKSFERSAGTDDRVKVGSSNGQLKTSTFKGKALSFLKGRFASENQVVKEEFKAALKQKYGDYAANTLAEKHGLDNAKTLTGRTIQAVLADAPKMQAFIHKQNQSVMNSITKDGPSGQLWGIAEQLIKTDPQCKHLENNPQALAKTIHKVAESFRKELLLEADNGKNLLKMGRALTLADIKVREALTGSDARSWSAKETLLSSVFDESNLEKLADTAAKQIPPGNITGRQLLQDNRHVVSQARRDAQAAMETTGNLPTQTDLEKIASDAFEKVATNYRNEQSEQSQDLVDNILRGDGAGAQWDKLKDKIETFKDVHGNPVKPSFLRTPEEIDDRSTGVPTFAKAEFESNALSDIKGLRGTEIPVRDRSADQPRGVHSHEINRLFEQSGIFSSELVRGNVENIGRRLKEIPSDSPIHDRLILSTDRELAKLIAENLHIPEDTPEVRSVIQQIRSNAPQTASSQLSKLEVKGEKLPDSITVNGTPYQATKVLKSGSNGTAIRYVAANGNSIVVKKIADSISVADPRLATMKEVQAHRFANGSKGHENVVGLIGPIRTETGDLLIAMEDAVFGDSSDFATQTVDAALHGNLISQNSANLLRTSMAKQILSGAQFLQEQQGMIHSDIKPGNVFIGADGSLKFGDFGGSATTPTALMDDVQFTAAYAPPEVTAHSNPNVDQKGDTFSVGVMVSEVFGGPGTNALQGRGNSTDHEWRQLWVDANPPGIHRNDPTSGQSGATPLDRLVNGLTNPDPKSRITLSAALKSSLFSDRRIDSAEIKEMSKTMALWQQARSNLAKETDPKLKSVWQSQVSGHENRLRQLSAAIGE